MRQSGFEPELLAWKAKVIPGYTTGARLIFRDAASGIWTRVSAVAGPYDTSLHQSRYFIPFLTHLRA